MLVIPGKIQNSSRFTMTQRNEPVLHQLNNPKQHNKTTTSQSSQLYSGIYTLYVRVARCYRHF